jgi:hypothetical protein
VAFIFLIEKLFYSHLAYGSRRTVDVKPSDRVWNVSERQIWVVRVLLFLAVGFAVVMSLGLKKGDRYLMPSIVTLDLVAGLGLVWLVEWLAQYLGASKVTMIAAMCLIFVGIQATLAWNAFPYFFSYYNPLFGGGRQAIKVVQIGWGEGLDQAARYLNSKPNSENLKVKSWYANGSFSYFSTSRVSPIAIDHPWTITDWKEFHEANYVVVYIHEWQRNLPPELLEYLKASKPEYSFWINGLEYVRVYKIQ